MSAYRCSLPLHQPFPPIFMSFLYNSFSSIWNTTASYFPETVKYCETNNINSTSVTNLAKEMALVPVVGALVAADSIGTAAMQAMNSVAEQAPKLAYSAKDLAANTAFSMLKSTHAWQFGTNAGATDGQAPSSTAMATELAGAAGSKLLGFGYSLLQSGYATLSEKAAQVGTAAWAEIKVQAPVLGAALLGGVEYMAGKTVAATQEAQAVMSAKPLDIDALDIGFEQEDMLHFSDLSDDVLPTMALPAVADDSTEIYFNAQEHAFAWPEHDALDSSASSFDDFDTECTALDSSEAWFMPGMLETSFAVAVC